MLDLRGIPPFARDTVARVMRRMGPGGFVLSVQLELGEHDD